MRSTAWGPWFVAACLAAPSGLLACSLLAPSDEELMGAVDSAGGTGGAVASAGAGADGTTGGRGGTGGAGGSSEIVGEYPVSPIGGSGGAGQPGAGGAPSSSADAGPIEDPPCVDCETVRMTGGLQTAELGTPGGSLYMDICPRDQVVVGMDYRFTFVDQTDFGYFTSLSLVCGELVPNLQAGSLDVVIGEPLTPRGGGAGASGSGGRCPLGQVVTGYDGVRNFDGTTSELRELTLHCAPLAITGDASVVRGTTSPTQPMSADFAVSTMLPTEILPLQPCPDGQVARGAAIHAGLWVDGVSLICSAPVLALPDGQSCGAAIECQSGICSGTCQPRPCTAPAGCSCRLFEDTQYAFCQGAQPQATAAAACAVSGMHLANARDPVAHGWLRNSAGREGVQADFWLGADDSLIEGDWQWAQGAGAVDLASELWEENEQRGGVDENCMAMTRNGHWDDVPCSRTLPFACEAP